MYEGSISSHNMIALRLIQRNLNSVKMKKGAKYWGHINQKRITILSNYVVQVFVPLRIHFDRCHIIRSHKFNNRMTSETSRASTFYIGGI